MVVDLQTEMNELLKRIMVDKARNMFVLRQGRRITTFSLWLFVASIALLIAACDGNSNDEPPATRTPVPTWTATPDPSQIVPTETATIEPTFTQVAEEPTAAPIETPSESQTEIVSAPEAEATPVETAEATEANSFVFDLETAEKFPTESLAPNMVRVYLYVSDQSQMALAGYRMLVVHENKQLAVDSLTEGGLPSVTSDVPGPFSRFTNMNAVFVESQSGKWTIQLLDANGAAVGPPAIFELTADETTREFYVHYRMK